MIQTKITGMAIYYYEVCKRKLWYYYNNLDMENENEDVIIGSEIDKTSYKNQRKHICIADEINIDYITKNKLIHEIKKSKKIEKASIWQVKYYLYYLKSLGVEDIRAKIEYPLLRQTLDVELSKEDEKELDKIISDILEIISSKKICELEKMKICKKCAYHDLCWI